MHSSESFLGKLSAAGRPRSSGVRIYSLHATADMPVSMSVSDGLVRAAGASLTGTWSGDWGPSATERTKVTFVMDWDGKNVTGQINPGPDSIPIASVYVDPSTWTVRIEADTKSQSPHFRGGAGGGSRVLSSGDSRHVAAGFRQAAISRLREISVKRYLVFALCCGRCCVRAERVSCEL